MTVTIPPFTDVPAPGDPVASAWAQALTQFAVDQFLAQPGQPVSAYTELWYDTDDPGMAFPNMPRGYVGHAVKTANQVFAASGDITGLSVTWTADPTRRYRTSFKLGIDKDGTAANVWIEIQTGASASVDSVFTLFPASTSNPIQGWTIESGLSGATTRKLRLNLNAGQATLAASAGMKAWIVVEDIGAADVSGGGVWSDAFPRGHVGTGRPNADTSIPGGFVMTDVAGLSVTFTADPTRRYKTTLSLNLRKDTAAGSMWSQIRSAASANLGERTSYTPTAGTQMQSTVIAIESGLSGTQTRKGSCSCDAAAGTVFSAGSLIVVEDIGI